MAVRIVLLGRLADMAGTGELEMPAPLEWAGLLAALPDDLAAEVSGERIRLALDGQVLAAKEDLQAQDGSEVALLPPVSGG
ncbi:MoaD/ThiS family protein [Paraurantiacibacter namhicola]|uniref:ThiS family protein n=1 Tax=Paraurantiacibacter namhicola TaxID=645517 RepID=A0A1C7D7T7_9SPHN|nr:MoaD/ThiS family protein [Paraurantiacibacter namhicola]ANU07422.1 ThiS family protein [Paraurantiacibacter namhicola]